MVQSSRLVGVLDTLSLPSNVFFLWFTVGSAPWLLVNGLFLQLGRLLQCGATPHISAQLSLSLQAGSALALVLSPSPRSSWLIAALWGNLPVSVVFGCLLQQCCSSVAALCSLASLAGFTASISTQTQWPLATLHPHPRTATAALNLGAAASQFIPVMLACSQTLLHFCSAVFWLLLTLFLFAAALASLRTLFMLPSDESSAVLPSGSDEEQPLVPHLVDDDVHPSLHHGSVLLPLVMLFISVLQFWWLAASTLVFPYEHEQRIAMLAALGSSSVFRLPLVVASFPSLSFVGPVYGLLPHVLLALLQGSACGSVLLFPSSLSSTGRVALGAVSQSCFAWNASALYTGRSPIASWRMARAEQAGALMGSTIALLV